MHLREPTQATPGGRKALHCLVLLLGSVLLQEHAFAGIGLRIQIGSLPDPVDSASPPYLTALGPPSLRFSDPLPQPGSVAPSAAAAPLPHLLPAETSVAAANAASVQAHPSPPAHPAAPVENGPDDPPAPSSASISILPDTVRPQVQAEDFLPYFVIPDAVKPSSTPPVPSEPGKLPPSSATYNQTR